MKVEFENGVASYSGKYNKVVYNSLIDGQLCIARQYVYPEISAHHLEMKEIMQNLDHLYKNAHPLYIGDLKTYARKNARENRTKNYTLMSTAPTSKSLFIKCMWEWYHSDPTHVDLKTVSIDDIMAMEAPLIKVAECVDTGYLRRVSGYAQLTHPIHV